VDRLILEAAWLCHAAFFLVPLPEMSADRPTPSAIEELLTGAMQALNAGELKPAEELCRRALVVQPGSLDALTLLGAITLSQGAHAEAERIYDELSRRQPREPTHWMNLGTARRGLARYDAALGAYSRAAQLGYLTADFFFNVGLTHLDRRDYESAREVLKRAHELAPGDALIRFQYVTACYESMQIDEAVTALEGWSDFRDLSTEHVAAVGQQLMNLGQSARAEAALRQLSAAQQLDPRAALTLLQILERTNQVEQARRILDRLLPDPRAQAFGPELVLSHAVVCQRESRHGEAIALFRQALELTPEPHDRHHVLYPLAKSLDATGRYSEAFQALSEAHEAQIAHLKLAAPLVVARGAPTMQITRYSVDPEDVAQWRDPDAPSAAESPIFVVAFPRSGTTLLEQTLDAHPALKTMDEQPIVQNALDDIRALGATYPELLAGLTAEQLATVRKRYFERAAARVTREPGQRLIDKNPLNLLRLPVIRRAFPNARIILAIRHPCDVVLSCFMQHFRAPEFALLCADLRTLATGYQESFDFWYRQVEILQPAVLEVRYEQFVADFENGVRQLASFLELPWHDAMLAPAEHARSKGFISTPSYSQVVQAVNQKAVGRWVRYERELAPIVPILRPSLQRWSYSVPS
jgi:tetratricopeptide (TPR) repeat protein